MKLIDSEQNTLRKVAKKFAMNWMGTLLRWWYQTSRVARRCNNCNECNIRTDCNDRDERNMCNICNICNIANRQNDDQLFNESTCLSGEP
jgi:hypothetical protein